MTTSLTPNAVQQTKPMRLYKDANGNLQIAVPYVLGSLASGVFTPFGLSRAITKQTTNTTTVDAAYKAAANQVATAEGLTFSSPFGAGTDTFIEVNG